jgi:hypothetical protein
MFRCRTHSKSCAAALVSEPHNFGVVFENSPLTATFVFLATPRLNADGNERHLAGGELLFAGEDPEGGGGWVYWNRTVFTVPS